MVGRYGEMKFDIEPHDFQFDLAWSEDMNQYAFYFLVLKYFYPWVANWDKVKNLIEQKKGNDIILEGSGKILNVQMKARRMDYGDIAIEYKHIFNDGKEKLGWVESITIANEIIYCIIPSGRAYKIPMKELQQAWVTNKNDWIKLYDLKPARNEDYVTCNCGIPIEILIAADINIETVQFEKAKVIPVYKEKEQAYFSPALSCENKPYHPLWSKKILKKWVTEDLGTKEQTKRYIADLEWYEHNN
jgi:hypothetical protein